MTRDEIIGLVLDRCGRRRADVFLAASAISELALIQARLEGAAFMPWFLLSDEDTSLVTVASSRSVDLPSGFLREHEDYDLALYDATNTDDPYTELTKDEYDYLLKRFPGGTGEPTNYSLLGSQLQLFPVPDAVYTLSWRYYKGGVALSAGDSTNVWTVNAADLLIAELGFVLSGVYLRDTVARDAFAASVVLANTRLLAFDEARKQANRDAQRGDKE